MACSHFIGADENGLGAVLGPMIVTAVLARADERGAELLSRRPPRWLAKDLDDSKRIVSHGNIELGEAWARAVVSPEASRPSELISKLVLEPGSELVAPCPDRVRRQCWGVEGERFEAEGETVHRMARHLEWLAAHGVNLVEARSSVLCVKRLNTALCRGHNRFSSDLHAMERLILALRERAGSDVRAVCGKVGAMENYDRFFGPLAGRLHAELERGRTASTYRFAGVGEIRFVMDADASHPLVMLASLIGKWARELLMARVSRWYERAGDWEGRSPSGYHDPTTKEFVSATAATRARRRVPDTCFRRRSEASV